MNLSQWAFVLLAGVASGGVLMTLLLAVRARIPYWLATAHGIAGLFAVGFLFVANLIGGDATSARSWWALGVLVGGFFGGLALFRVVFKERATLPLAMLHGSLGAAGLALLYGPAFSV